jgi:hypothetical protein
MSFYPPVPISFSSSGDTQVAAAMQNEGRRRTGELFNALSGGYGNPHYDDIDDRLFTGKAGPFYYRTKSNHFVTINIKINGALIYCHIDAIPYGEQEAVEYCRCCRDCIAIGVIVEKEEYSNSPPRYLVDLCYQGAGESPYVKVRLVDKILAADGNPDITIGDKYIVFATPALLNNGDPFNNIPFATNLRTWDGSVNHRQAGIWQVFNCMELSSVNVDGVDLLPEGIDNSLYAESDNVCQKANKQVPLEDPKTTESDPIPAENVQFILTSIRAGDCLDMQ